MRLLAGTSLLLAGVIALAGCGGADEGSSSTDRDRLCQTVLAQSALLAGARDHLGRGEFFHEDIEAYGQSTKRVLDVLAAGATDSDAAEATLGLLDAQSRVRGFVVTNVDADTYDSGRAERLLAEEAEALDGVEAACR